MLFAVAVSSAATREELLNLVDSAYAVAMDGRIAEAISINRDGLAQTPEDSVALQCEFYSCLLYCYHRLGDYQEALRYGELCLLYDEQHGTQEDLSASLGNLAGVYSSAGKQEVAIEYLRRAIDIENTLLSSDTTHTPKSLAIRKAMLGEVLLARSKSLSGAEQKSILSEALQLTDDALQIERQLGRRAQEGMRMAQLANIYAAMDQTTHAKEYNRQALAIARETGNKPSELIILLQDNQLRQAYTLARELGMKKQEYEACDRLYQQSAANGQWSEALQWLEKARVLHEQIQSEETARQLTMAQVKYDTFRKEQQIAGQQHTIETEQARSHQLLLFSLLAIAVAALLTVVVLLLWYRKKAIEETARYKERQYTILTHDLTNPMVAQQQVLRMLYRDFEFYTAEQTHALVGQLLSGSDSQLALLRNLGEIAHLEQGKRTMQPTRLDLSSLVEDTVLLMRSTASMKGVEIITKTQRTLVTADREALRTVLRNLLSNAIKFAPKGSVVEVGTTAPGTLYVHNSGEPVSPELIDEIMHATTRVVSRIGTNGESGTGIGLLLCRELIRLNNGTLTFESSLEKGTTVTVMI
jgi:signal transduction histidine kinase